MIIDHGPAVRVPPDHAASSVAAVSQREETWKTAEILILRHQLAVLQQRQPASPEPELGGPGPARDPAQRDTESTPPRDAAAGHPGHDPALAPDAIAGRWIGGCRRELLDRTLIWNQAHLQRILREYETHHNLHRPHRSLHGAASLKPLPEPVDLAQYRVRRQARVGGLISEYRLAT
jgi:hypothetical protein